MYSNKNLHYVCEVKRVGYDVSITSLCESMVDCFVKAKNVAGSIPAEAPYKSNVQSCSLFFTTFVLA